MQSESRLRGQYTQPWGHGDGIVQGRQGRLHKTTVFEFDFEGPVPISKVERGEHAEEIAYKGTVVWSSREL